MPEQDASKLAAVILDNFINRLGSAWDKLAEEDQQLWTDLADTYADLTVQAFLNPKDATVKRKRKKVEATIAHVGSIDASKARVEWQAAVRAAAREALALVIAVA
jgi:TRAP-type C4-dicarboxylate transport system substrate-binding protein